MKSITFAIFLLAASVHPALAKDNAQIIELQVTEKGFEPSAVTVKPGKPIVLKITRKTDSTCATQVKIPSKNIKKDLPLNKTITVDLGIVGKGAVPFSCGMDMITGLITVQ